MINRRTFVQAAGAGLAAVTYRAGASDVSDPRVRDPSFEHGRPLREFGYGQVCLQPGPQQAQLEQTHGILMGMNEDSLLRPFRMAAGMPAPGNDMGGWYSSPRFLAETFGQWVSALSRYYAATGDGPTRLKIDRLITGFFETSKSAEQLLRANGNPLYFHDKLVVGIEDAVWALDRDRVSKMLSRFADATNDLFINKHTSKSWPAPDVMQEQPDSLSVYNFAETYLTAWQRSGDSRYLELAMQDLQDGFCEPLSRGENVLGGHHAYGHINTLCGAAKAYLVLGEEKYLRAATNGLAFAAQQSFATGGYGPGEGFLPKKERRYSTPGTGEVVIPAVATLGESILREQHHFETGCGSYAHFKLTRYLLRITKNPEYGDSMERIMYNAALGALPLNKFGKAFYQSNYHARARKEYFDGYGNVIEDEWPCCSGTLPQLAADYRISAYFNDERGVYVNLYIPSAVNWAHDGAEVSLAQSGQYPLADAVTLTVKTSRPATFAVRLRIPAWARSPSVHVNGKPIAEAVRPGTFATVQRRWRSGDRIELKLPCRLELKAADTQHPNLVALVYGPIVLFVISDDTPRVTRAQLLAAKQRTPGGEEWEADSADGPLRLLPWWAIGNQTYTTYITVS